MVEKKLLILSYLFSFFSHFLDDSFDLSHHFQNDFTVLSFSVFGISAFSVFLKREWLKL